MAIRFGKFVGIVLLMVAFAATASAQATRTWVSGVGDDANPCSRTAPCKTFAGAISKTAAKGEISVLDPGGFGAVTITKSITINGDGTLAGILAAGTNGVIVNAGATDVVTLRNISINGAGTGLDGVRYLAGNRLIIQNCNIYGFTSDGIEMNVSTIGPILQVIDTNIFNNTSSGIRTTTSVVGQRASFSVTRGSFMQNAVGVLASTRSNGAITGTTFAAAGTAAIQVDGSTSEVNVEGALITQSAIGLQTLNSATARISNCYFAANATAINNGGTVQTFQNNRFGGNVNPNAGAAITNVNQQ